MGDRPRSMQRALTALGRLGRLERTASLYESEAALVAGPRYLNTVCAVRTALSPQQLLVALKEAEVKIGRVPGPRFGPRAIDLDILLYDDAVISEMVPLPSGVLTGTPPGADLELEIPHPRLEDRSFVLQPLSEIAPTATHPRLGRTAAELSASLGEPPLTRVTPLGASALAAGEEEGELLRWGGRTHLMGVINVTPDSFSDGGKAFTPEVAHPDTNPTPPLLHPILPHPTLPHPTLPHPTLPHPRIVSARPPLRYPPPTYPFPPPDVPLPLTPPPPSPP